MRRSFVAVVAAWLVVVAIGSTLVWAVISRVGDGLVTTADPSVTPSATPPAASSGSPSGSSSGSPAVEARRATWQGLGGTVVAECTRGAIRQVSVVADPGFRVEVGNPGPEELEVEFEGREDEEGSESKVRAECVAGEPRFSAETED